MFARLAVAAVAVGLFLVACGPTPPTTVPAPSSTSTALASASQSPSPAGALPLDDPAYLAAEAFAVPAGDAGADWTVPTPLPLMPNGQAAVRVAFLPASCATGNFTITTSVEAPDDAWEASLRIDGTKHGYTMGSWPAAQVPECADQQGRTYLQVGYRPFATVATIHLALSITNVNNAPATVDVVPVFTSADASHPALTMLGVIALKPAPGREKPSSAKPQQLAAYDYARATLPDGSTPTRWGLFVTGCGPVVGRNPIVVSVRVGGTAPVDIGRCSGGSFLSYLMTQPVPADGTHIVVLTSGGTTKSQVRISEFQWRGDLR